MGSLELLKETPLSPTQTDLVDTVISSNNVLLMLIEDILELVKIEYEDKKQTKTERETVFSMGDCLKSLKDVATGYANQFMVLLDFEIEEKVRGWMVSSNRSRLHQILSNLLTNAVKASRQEGRVELHCESVKNCEKSTLMFRIKDYGSGIPKSKLESIFEPFVQLHNVNESIVPRYVIVMIVKCEISQFWTWIDDSVTPCESNGWHNLCGIRRWKRKYLHSDTPHHTCLHQ